MKNFIWMLNTLLLIILFTSAQLRAEKVELIADINTSPTGSWLGNYITPLNNKLYFTGDDGVLGEELYVYDCETAITELVADIFQGSQSSSPSNIIVFDNKLYFSANDGIHGVELHVYDPATDKTQLVLDIYEGDTGSYPTMPIVYKGNLFFGAFTNAWDMDWVGKLYVINKGGIELIIFEGLSLTDFESKPSSFAIYDEKLYFSAGYLGGTHLFFYDFESSIFNHVNSASSGVDVFFPSYLTVYKDRLYFAAVAQEWGSDAELYSFDKKTNNISVVTDISDDVTGSHPQNLTVYHDKLYFFAGEIHDKKSLYVFDDVTSGARKLSEGNNFIDYRTTMKVVNDELYFSFGSEIHGIELYTLDEQNNQIKMVKDIYTGSFDSRPEFFTAYNDRLYFKARNDSYEGKLFEYNTLLNEVTVIAEILADKTQGSNPSHFTRYNKKLYFFAIDNAEERTKLYYFDDETEETVLVSDINSRRFSSGSYYRDISSPIIYNNKLYFFYTDQNYGNELFVYDQKTNNVSLVKDLRVGEYGSHSSFGSASTSLTVVNDKLYFIAYGSDTRYKLYSHDGRINETKLLSDNYNITSNLLIYNDKLYFSARNLGNAQEWPGTHGEELYQYDTEKYEFQLVKDINSQPLSSQDERTASSSPTEIFVDNNLLYFTAYDGISYKKFYSYDGNTLTVIENGPATYRTPFIYKSKWYFSTKTALGPALEIFDNSTFESKIIDYQYPHDRHGKPFNLFFYNNGFYFSVSDYEEDKTKLLYLDIVTESISPVSNEEGLIIDNLYNRASSFTHLNNKVYYSGLLEDGGFELFSFFSNSSPTGELLITGSAIEGKMLTVVQKISDVDGLGYITYQWYLNDVAIEDASNNSILVTNDYVGMSLTVIASYYDGEGTFEQLTSGAVTPLSDFDGDGIADETDTDDDNDGVLDSNDAFPLDASRSMVEVDKKSSSGGSFGFMIFWLLLAYSFRQKKTQAKYYQSCECKSDSIEKNS